MVKSINSIGNYTYFKNCEHVCDDSTCEYQSRTTEQQYSMAISIVSCIYPTKYAIEMKDKARGIRHVVIMTFFVTIEGNKKFERENCR